MDYKSKIEEDLKGSLKQRDAVRVSVLRMLLAAIKNKEVEKIRALSDDEFYFLVKTSINQHLDSIESFKKVNALILLKRKRKNSRFSRNFCRNS